MPRLRRDGNFDDTCHPEAELTSSAHGKDVVIDLRYATPQLAFIRDAGVIELDARMNGSTVNGEPKANGNGSAASRTRRTRPLRATT